MLYLYLDESGDLGFDFVNKKPSKFFTVTIVAVNGYKNNRKLISVAKKTLRRKLNKKSSTRVIEELKGSRTTIGVKKYFWNLAKDIDFSIYAMTLNKKRVYEELTRKKDRVYNFIARQVLDRITFDYESHKKIVFVIDKSKAKPEIEEFNSYIRRQIEGRIHPSIPLNIDHLDSKENRVLQICDMFCWGIYVSYERKNFDWKNIFLDKIAFDEVYLTQKK